MEDIGDFLKRFISSHSDLIGEYEGLECSIPVEYCEDEMKIYCDKICKIDKNTDLDNILYKAFQASIRYNTNILDSLETTLNSLRIESHSLNSTQQYFKEINDIYAKYNNDYDIEYSTENRDKLIEMNLKTVISIAKKYQGLGLSLPELISAGNLGLAIAWDKFDPNRSKLKDNMISAIKGLPDSCSFNEIYDAIKNYLTYGDIKKKFLDKFNEKEIYLKNDILKWIDTNIHNAKFNSIATMWIRAYILIEIDTYSRLVKKPKSEIYKDKERLGAYKKEITIDIDSNISNDSDIKLNDILKNEEESYSDLEVSEAYDFYKKNLNKLLEGVKPRDRAIFLKKFGIGLPRPMLPKEIAEQEGLSIARVSQIFQSVIEKIRLNQAKYNIDTDMLFNEVRKFK